MIVQPSVWGRWCVFKEGIPYDQHVNMCVICIRLICLSVWSEWQRSWSLMSSYLRWEYVSSQTSEQSAARHVWGSSTRILYVHPLVHCLLVILFSNERLQSDSFQRKHSWTFRIWRPDEVGELFGVVPVGPSPSSSVGRVWYFYHQRQDLTGWTVLLSLGHQAVKY